MIVLVLCGAFLLTVVLGLASIAARRLSKQLVEPKSSVILRSGSAGFFILTVVALAATAVN